MNRREVATSLVEQRPKSSAFFQQATPERWPHAKGRSAVTQRGESPPRTPSTSVTIPRHEDRKRVHRSLRGQLRKKRGSDRPQHPFLLLRTSAGNRGPKTANSRQKCRTCRHLFQIFLGAAPKRPRPLKAPAVAARNGVDEPDRRSTEMPSRICVHTTNRAVGHPLLHFWHGASKRRRRCLVRPATQDKAVFS